MDKYLSSEEVDWPQLANKTMPESPAALIQTCESTLYAGFTSYNFYWSVTAS